MKTDEASGTTPQQISAEVSELLLAWTAMGRGVEPPTEDFTLPGAVFTAGLSDAAVNAFLKSEALFSDQQSDLRKPDRKRLKELEAELATMKGRGAKRGRSSSEPWDPAVDMLQAIRREGQPAVSIDGLQKEIEELSDRLSKITAVTWDDPDANRATILEMMTKSAFGALSIVDITGGRIMKAQCSRLRLIMESDIVALTNRASNALTLIRANATGGANIHSLSGSLKPVFNYLSRVSPEMAAKLGKKVTRKPDATTFTGSTIIAPVPCRKGCPSELGTEGYLYLMQHVYTLGEKSKDHRLRVVFESPELADEWAAFMSWGYKEFFGGDATDFASAAAVRMEASFATITSFASRAACALAVIGLCGQRGGKLPADPQTQLTREHLTRAKTYARFLVDNSYAMGALRARTANASTARAARQPDSALMVTLAAALEAAIVESGRGMVSRKKALSIPGMTSTALEIFGSGVTFQELTGRSEIKMGTTERAYCLRKEVTMDPEEAVAELAAATKEFEEHPNIVCSVEAANVMAELMRKANDNNQTFYMPCVPIGQMSVRQIKHLPLILRQHSPGNVILRGGVDDPEPEHLIDDDEENPLLTGVPNLWFRGDEKGMDFRNWTIAAKLGFANIWGNPPEQ